MNKSGGKVYNWKIFQRVHSRNTLFNLFFLMGIFTLIFLVSHFSSHPKEVEASKNFELGTTISTEYSETELFSFEWLLMFKRAMERYIRVKDELPDSYQALIDAGFLFFKQTTNKQHTYPIAGSLKEID